MSFLAHLHARLVAGEHRLLLGDARAADAAAVDILRDLVSLYCTGGRFLTPQYHACVDGCVCEAAMILHIQAGFEMQRTEADMREDVVETYYGETKNMPYEVFNVWMSYHLSYGRYELCCQELMRYLDHHFAKSMSEAEAFVAAIPLRSAHGATSDAATGVVTAADAAAQREAENARYLHLLHVLLFDVLVPLRAYDEAIAFLQHGRKVRPHDPPHRDSRISVSTREEWVRRLRELQALQLTHPLAAFEAADNQARMLGEPTLAPHAAHPTLLPPSAASPSSPSLLFHAGLDRLHAGSFYSGLPAASLPGEEERAGAGAGAGEEEEAEGGARERQEEMEQEDEEADGATTLFAGGGRVSKALIPHAPLLPLLPDVTAPNFLLSAWLRSLGHRVYLLLHARWPLLANRVRLAASWVWSRRSMLAAAVCAYLAYRLLHALIVYFRLAELPGVALLVAQIRNFIRIAFISGTGRSLFG